MRLSLDFCRKNATDWLFSVVVISKVPVKPIGQYVVTSTILLPVESMVL